MQTLFCLTLLIPWGHSLGILSTPSMCISQYPTEKQTDLSKGRGEEQRGRFVIIYSVGVVSEAGKLQLLHLPSWRSIQSIFTLTG